jgi:subfamily B ATP-binding cassette protein MsbA
MSNHSQELGTVRAQMLRMWSLARPYLGRIVLCLALVLAATLLQLTLPLGIRYIFDTLLVSGDTRVIHLVTFLLLGVFLVRSALSFWGQFVLQVTGDRIIVSLRNRLFEHLHALGLDFHQTSRVGDLLSRLGNDVAAIRNVVANLSISLVVNVCLLLGASTVMLLMNWRLGLMVLAVAPLTSLVSHLFGPVFQRLATKIQDELAQSTVIAQESLSGMEVAQGFGRAEHESKRYRAGLVRFLAEVIKARKTDAFFNALVAFLTSTSTIAIFWYGGLEVLAGRLSAGTLVAFLLYSQNITQAIGAIAQHYAAFRQSMGASIRVFELIDLEPTLRDRPDAVDLDARSADLHIDRVHFGYRSGEPVLRGIDLHVPSGQTVALVGPSGAGKSTLLKLIPRFFDPLSGCIRINGRDLRDYRLQSLREAIAVVSQDVFLFGGSVRENIRYGRLDATDEDVELAAKAANAHEFIECLPAGYDTEVGERGLQLSGGQRQRISIARALLKDAPILLLDEATSAVDPASECLIQQAIERLRGRRTTLLIAHREATVRSADQILLMERGMITGRPSFEELLARSPGGSSATSPTPIGKVAKAL